MFQRRTTVSTRSTSSSRWREASHPIPSSLLLPPLQLVRRLMLCDLTTKLNKQEKTTWVENPINNYKLLITIKPDKQEYELSLQCLDPSMSF